MQPAIILVFLLFLLYITIKRHRHLQNPEVRKNMPRKTWIFISVSNYVTFVLFGLMIIIGIIQYVTK